MSLDVALLEEKEALVTKIVAAEWEVFDKINGLDGRAACQDDFETFEIMRSSQFLVWDIELLSSYMVDFEKALLSGLDLVTHKYANMMKSTEPEAYQEMEAQLPKISKEQSDLIEEIVKIQLDLMLELQPKYPHFVNTGRSLQTSEDSVYNTSYETYLRGELSAYSMRTVTLYREMLENHKKNGENTAILYMLNVAKQYGYEDLESAEANMAAS